MNAASVVSTSSSSHRNVRMMLDMMPSEPLPAITFSTFRSNSARQHLAQVEPAVGVEIQTGQRARHGLDGLGRRPQRILVRRQLGDAGRARTAGGPIRSCARPRRAAEIRYREEPAAPISILQARPGRRVRWTAALEKRPVLLKGNAQIFRVRVVPAAPLLLQALSLQGKALGEAPNRHRHGVRRPVVRPTGAGPRSRSGPGPNGPADPE